MADLDDFFAKKDKKKGKTKKFLSSEELAKQLEQSAKEREQNKNLSKKDSKIEEETEQQITKAEPDDEWKQFEDEKRPDLSNLKLGQLSSNDQENINNQNAGLDYDNENSQFDGDNSENPWNKSGPAPKAAAAPKQEAPPKNTGVYVAPGTARSDLAAKARLNRKNAPDLKNEEYFPSLGTEKPCVEPMRLSKKDGFEEVKHGGKFQQSSSTTASVSLGNVYSTLLNESLDS